MLQVLLVDDEPLARQRLKTLLGEPSAVPVRVVGEAADAEAAWQAVADSGPDLLLLDVQMPGLDGLGLAQRLQALPRPPAVVFITAHAEHALQAFEVEAVDYLTKPVRLARLHVALARAQQWLQARPAPEAGEERVLVVQERGRVIRLPVAEVLYLKAEQKYVTVRTASTSHLLDDSLNELEKRLGPGFLRVHRNALVARRAVRALAERVGVEGEVWAVHVAAVDEWIDVSRRQLGTVREALSRT